ncbi:MAG: hypothetical protein ACJ754_19340, partial [Pyrinomonadaceae bacterium]
MSSALAERKERAGRPRFESFDGPRIYKHVKRERPCRICGKTDWCSYSLNEEVSCCARENKGADYVSRQGWGIDDAAFLDLPLRSLAVAEWYATLSGPTLEEVTKVRREMRYRVG